MLELQNWGKLYEFIAVMWADIATSSKHNGGLNPHADAYCCNMIEATSQTLNTSSILLSIVQRS